MALVGTNQGNYQSSPQPGYTCGNCGRTIGALEQPYQWGQHVVCPECCASLQAASFPPAPSYQPPRKRRGESQQGMALAGFILAFFFSPLGLIFSLIALSGMKRTRNDEGKGFAIAGLILSIVSLVISVIWIIVIVSAVNSIQKHIPPAAPPPERHPTKLFDE